MTRMSVDFNAIVRDGLIKGSAKRADGRIEVGMPVELFDAGEPGMEFDADVVEYDPVTGKTLLRVHWEPAAASDAADWIHLHEVEKPASIGACGVTLNLVSGFVRGAPTRLDTPLTWAASAVFA